MTCIYIVRSLPRSIVNTVAGHSIGIQLVGCNFGIGDTNDMYVYIFTYLFISLFQSIVNIHVIHKKVVISLAIVLLGIVIPYKGYLVSWL